jgi:hypothetical protein
MTNNTKRRLLVEGRADEEFFTEFCKKHGFDTHVEVVTPRGAGGTHNGKEHVISRLGVLAKQFNQADLTHLAAIVDADQARDGGGISKTLEKVGKVLAPQGFNQAGLPLDDGGFVFTSDRGFADIGLWIMPNNQDEGMLEDWISQVVHQEQPQQTLLAHANSVVANLPVALFGPTGVKKAEIASWLAWQADPGKGLYHTIKARLLDPAAPLYTGLKAWMEHVYPPPIKQS